ncbi:MBL fold metallo-hydrolase [Pseudobdellovibrio sp. HCB154]|uniref:MBL fold metallo-hydrolase n=1 Tax=Pseudobdellovibrio sp. HCB154 TaxID=3386277 RepID=UPI0039171C95
MKLSKTLLSLSCLLVVTIAACAMKSKYPITDHFDGKKFYHAGLESDHSLWSVFKWAVSRPDLNFPEWLENKFKPQLPQKLEEKKVAATFINHSTFLLQTKNFNFLTDPIWSKRTSPVSFLGPKRFRDPGMKIEELPPIHFVVLSHNHYDHFDLQTIKDLHQKFKPVFIMALGNSKLIADIKDIQVVELDWWQSHTVPNNGSKAKITLVPAQHWSARGLTDQREALWGGYVIESDSAKIYFAGDTGYNEGIFTTIADTFKEPDLALLPIGAYEPRWFMKNNHINPEESVQIHLTLKPKISVAMHYGAFRLSDEDFGQPEKDLATAKKNSRVENFVTLEVGETKVF